jgi:hypothetical protein
LILGGGGEADQSASQGKLHLKPDEPARLIRMYLHFTPVFSRAKGSKPILWMRRLTV